MAKFGSLRKYPVVGQFPISAAGHVPYHYEFSKVLNSVKRDYQPIWLIRS
jgi:hypothetical protein